MLYKHLKKPFKEFKWRWASLTPSEGLNDPRVYLGVLRALRICEGKAASSNDVFVALKNVEDDLKGYLAQQQSLARDKDRNLLRNSQQYWSSLGLLRKTNPYIELTTFGKNVADGVITYKEFAEEVVNSLQLPNSKIESIDTRKKWIKANINLTPLKLILYILCGLNESSSDYAYLTNEELTKVVIPLSSVNASIVDYIEQLLEFRRDPNSVSTFEDFATGANDKRMSREFLLFLSFYGFVHIANPSASNLQQKFTLTQEGLNYIEGLGNDKKPELTLAQPNKVPDPDDVIKKIRPRKLVSVTHRPEQPKFRKDVLESSAGVCLISKETLKEVLRACHIVPVESLGSDDVGNGLCLREDLHILFDSGHLRIDTDGIVHLSKLASTSNSYKAFANLKVEIPEYVDKNCLAHRWKYF